MATSNLHTTNTLTSKDNKLKRKRVYSSRRSARPIKALKPSAQDPSIDLNIDFLEAEPAKLAYFSRQPLFALQRLQAGYNTVLEKRRSLTRAFGERTSAYVVHKSSGALLKGPIEINKATPNGNITWLDVIKFAKDDPKDFECDASSDGLHRFTTHGVTVGIPHEDYLLICSGFLSKLIKPIRTRIDLRRELRNVKFTEKKLEGMNNELRKCGSKGASMM